MHLQEILFFLNKDRDEYVDKLLTWLKKKKQNKTGVNGTTVWKSLLHSHCFSPLSPHCTVLHGAVPLPRAALQVSHLCDSETVIPWKIKKKKSPNTLKCGREHWVAYESGCSHNYNYIQQIFLDLKSSFQKQKLGN